MIKKYLSKITRNLITYIKFKNNTLNFYHFPVNKNIKLIVLENDITFRTITSETEYESFCNFYSIPFNKNYKERFNSKSIFAVLVNKIDYVSYGWLVSNLIGFPIDEINVYISITSNTYVLFDFHTNIRFRNRKFYQLLLNQIIYSFKGFDLIIYVLLNNLPSDRAICKSGFDFVGISKFNRIDFVNLFNLRNVKIKQTRIKSKI